MEGGVLYGKGTFSEYCLGIRSTAEWRAAKSVNGGRWGRGSAMKEVPLPQGPPRLILPLKADSTQPF